MTNRSPETLDRPKKLLHFGLAAVAAQVAVIGIAIGVGNVPAIHAQAPVPPLVQTRQADAGQPAFDAASIKPNSAGGGSRVVVGAGPLLKFTPGRVAGTKVTGRRIILEAYHLSEYQLAGGPDWLDTDRFDLEGKADSPATEDQLRKMLQTLLNQRFKLSLHHELKEMPVYFLEIAKGGLKVPEWKPGDPQPTVKPRQVQQIGGMLMDHVSMQDFAGGLFLSNNPNIDRPVLDKTGLTGKYFFAVQWAADENFKTVAEDYFGLRFVSQKAPVDILVIDRVERPEPN